MNRQKVVATVPTLRRQKRTLYCIDKDGDICAFRQAVGHYSVPTKIRKVLRLGLRKEKGYLYYLNGKNQVIQQPMYQFRKRKSLPSR